MPSTESAGQAASGMPGKRVRPQPERTSIEQLAAIEVRSAEKEVYEALRHQIIHGLPPRTPLRLAQLADRFKISTMPVRSAIARLEAEGMVVQRPRRGAIVSDLTMEDFTDLYAIRMGLEGVAARCGCVALSDDDLGCMRECLDNLMSIGADRVDSIDHYLMSEWKMHDICYEAARRPKAHAAHPDVPADAYDE